MNRLFPLALIALMALFSAPMFAQIQFGAGISQSVLTPTMPAGSNDARGLDSADIDLDGDLDLVICDRTTNEFVVILNNGSGVFTAQTPVLSAGGLRDVELADLNGDFFADLVMTHEFSDEIEIRLNDGTGAFPTAVVLPLGTMGAAPRDAEAADFDADGDRDLVVALYNTAEVMLLTNNAGVFSVAGTFPTTGGNAYDLAVGDLNGDFRPDVAVANSSFGNPFQDNVGILMNDGAGGLSPVVTFSTGSFNSGVAIADFDLDTNPDVAASTFVNAGGNLFPLFGDGTGNLVSGASTGSGVHINGIQAADLDLDGDLDIVAFDVGTGSGSVFRNDGGAFVFAGALPTSASAGAVTTGDFDGDGSVDVVFTVRSTGEVTSFFNQNVSPSLPADCAASRVPDGLGGFEDLLFVNGSTGGASFRVDLAPGQFSSLDFAAPSASSVVSEFLIWGEVFVPGRQLSVFDLPLGIGVSCLTPAQVDIANPNYLLIANNIGGNDPNAIIPSAPGPISIGFTAAMSSQTVILQGLVKVGPTDFVLTNAVMARVP